MSKKQKNAKYKNLKKKLNKLFEYWEEALSCLKDKFVIDGALPGYPHQKIKILYIGQESHGSGGNTLMENICIGTSYPSLPTSTFRRVVLFAHGLLNNKTWEEVEKWQADGGVVGWKDDIKTPGKPNKELSFAFMNVSKYDNEDENGAALSGDFKKYVDESLGENKSKRNFIRAEIDLLNPDLIISWNLRAKLGVKRFKKILTGDPERECRPIKPKSHGFLTDADRAWIYECEENRKILLLDTWHFSARNKYNGKDFYNPLREVANSKAVKDLIAKKSPRQR